MIPLRALLLILCLTPLYGQDSTLSLASIFKDHMVLQQNSQASIWGKASPNQSVRFSPSWTKSAITTTADASGKWLTKLPTPKAGGPYTIKISSTDTNITLKDILIGEVWICGGQSNMQWKMVGFGLDHWKDDLAAANNSQIRLCHVDQVMALSELDELSCNWAVSSPSSASRFSAIGYFFGEQLYRELKVPIGLISSNWGGSSAEAWVSPDILGKKHPEFKATLKSYPKLQEEHGVRHTRSKNTPKGINQQAPSLLYNAMLHPLIPFTFRGVIWYQGESNVANPAQYRTLFPNLITNWRNKWQQGDFPFYFVQIAPFHYRYEPTPTAFLREAQLNTLSLPNTGMVVTMDVGDPTNIHPKLKKPVAERLVRLALSQTYGKKDLVYSGPQYREQTLKGSEIHLGFDHLGSGLATSDNAAPSHFTIAGKDQVFHPAEARIEGHDIIVSSQKVTHPVAVRYAWGNDDMPNLINKEGLPASSFRTDDWPIKKRQGPPIKK
ncbi:sialate O-acetylesterase [Verrucomicrobiaceae bacterium 227]